MNTATLRTRLDREHRLCGQAFVRTMLAASIAALLVGSGAVRSAAAPTPVTHGSVYGASQPPTTSKVATFGVQPAGPSKPDGRTYFNFAATDGGALTDHIAVVNYTFRNLTLTLHATDATNTPQGDFALIPPDQRSSQVGLWIKIPAAYRTVTIKPRGTLIVPFRVVVPHNSQPGDHAGGIIATLESFARSSSGQRYRLLQSVGSRVFIRLSGVLRPGLAVVGITPRYYDSFNPVGGGRVVLTYTVKNVGNVALGGRQTVRISGLFGLSATAKDVREIGVLLPGFSAQQFVEVRGVFPQFLMTAHVSIKPLVLPGSIQTLPNDYSGSAHFWANPWILLAMILLLLLGSWWRRMRRRRKPSPEVTSGSAPSSETPSIATAGNGRTAEQDPISLSTDVVSERHPPEPGSQVVIPR